MDDGMSEKLFNTIYGRNLIGELKNIVQRPYLVVTMEDIWSLFKDNFDRDAIVYFVKTLEYEDLLKETDDVKGFRCVVGLGGGQAVDVAKVVSWKTNLPLYQAPTSIATNAVFGHRAGLRFDGKVRYVTFTEPVAVYVDYGVIQKGPRSLNRSGVCDILCYHNAVYDWKYAHDKGKCEPQWPYDEKLASESMRVFHNIVNNIDEIYNMSENGIRVLTEGLRWGGAAFHNAGWNPRHIEGTDHFLFYVLEHMTRKKFIHGQPVCLGIYTGSEMQENEPDEMLSLIHRAGVDIRPESMGITWEDVGAALKRLKTYVEEAGLWYTVANDFEVDDAFIKKIREKILSVYGG